MKTVTLVLFSTVAITPASSPIQISKPVMRIDLQAGHLSAIAAGVLHAGVAGVLQIAGEFYI
jgi:hypothetical protein